MLLECKKFMETVLLIVIIYAVAVTKGGEVNMKCNGVDMKLSEKQMSHLTDCAATVGIAAKAELSIDKVPCFAKCLFAKRQLVDEKGMLHKENAINMFTNTMPDQMKASLKASIEKCMDVNGASVKPNDETCHSYTGLAVCIHSVFGEICKVNF